MSVGFPTLVLNEPFADIGLGCINRIKANHLGQRDPYGRPRNLDRCMEGHRWVFLLRLALLYAHDVLAKHGLSRMSRNHIHLAQGFVGDVISGMPSRTFIAQT
jgi:hypothetical protein